jgi:hypothetical protein
MRRLRQRSSFQRIVSSFQKKRAVPLLLETGNWKLETAVSLFFPETLGDQLAKFVERLLCVAAFGDQRDLRTARGIITPMIDFPLTSRPSLRMRTSAVNLLASVTSLAAARAWRPSLLMMSTVRSI